MPNIKKIFLFSLALLLVVVATTSAQAKSYKSVLKHNTQKKNVFVWDNMEVRLIWNATYFSPDYKEALTKRLEEMGNTNWWAMHELEKGDVFFVGLYQGSAEWAEIGKDDGALKFEVIRPDGEVIQAKRIENIPITQTERSLFPYLDKWSKAYLVTFPKNSVETKTQLKLLSPSAQSVLKFK